MTHDDLTHSKQQLLDKIKHLEEAKTRFSEESEGQITKLR